MNANINKIAEAADLLTARAANLAVMTALTGQQKADFTENVGDIDYVTVAIALGGNSARLVDDEWHRAIGGGNLAASEYVRGLETLLNDIDTDALYRAELWDGADPEGEESFRPLYYTKGDLDTARNMYQIAAQHMAQLLAANQKRHGAARGAKTLHGTRKTSTRRETQTPAGARFLTHAIHSSVENPPRIARRARRKTRGKRGTQVTTNTNNNAAGAAGNNQYVTDRAGRTWKWTTFGQLQEGDMIPDENGNPTHVTVAYPTHTPKEMIEFTHKDGTFTVGGTHLLYVETSEDQALHAHRLTTARHTLAPLMSNPGVKATLETIAHHGGDTEGAINQGGVGDSKNTPPIPGSALTFHDTCTPEELYDAVLASWNQYAHYLNKQQNTGAAANAEAGAGAGRDNAGDGAGETTATGDTYLGDRAVSNIAATLALETHRCAAAIGPAAEDTTLGYTGPDSQHMTRPVSAPQLAAQLLAVCAGDKYALAWPPIIGRVITALEAEQLLQEGRGIHIPNPPTNLT